jgi:endonuclease III
VQVLSLLFFCLKVTKSLMTTPLTGRDLVIAFCWVINYSFRMTREEKVKLVIERLERVYPNPRSALDFRNALELLVATMLSAQTTDKLVNTVTPAVFRTYRSAVEYAQASYDELDKLIQKVNFHRNKAKNIIAAGKVMVEKHYGEVPQTMEELDALPGVARKTANVVLGNAFGKAEGIAVDTHVMRLSQKLGLTIHHDPVNIEKDLMKIVPKEKWISFSHLLILHGRDICTARPHSCKGCPLGEMCPENV